MRFFWPRAESQIYAEAKSLVEKGWARADTVSYGRRTRTIYSITTDGRQALRDWLTTPDRGTTLECEPLLRIFLGAIAGPETMQASLTQVRADADAILEVGRRVSAEYLAGTAPFQDQVHVRAIIFDFLSHHALMLQEWAGRTQATLDRWASITDEQRASEALTTIGAIRAEYPDAATIGSESDRTR